MDGINEVHILGLDVSMNACGWGVLKIQDKVPIYVDSGVLKGSGKQKHGERLRNQRQLFTMLIQKYRPTHVARESGFSRHTRATQVLYKAYGNCDEFFAEHNLVEYSAATIKKVIGGNGRASKHEVEQGLRLLLNIPLSVVFTSNDETDAIAVALTLIFEQNLVRGDGKYDKDSHRRRAWR